MPSIELRTNVRVQDPLAFQQAFSKFAAETLGKPHGYVLFEYNYNEHMMFGGSPGPALLLTILDVNNFTPEANENYSKKFFAFLKEKLGVPDDRGYIAFSDFGPSNVGYASTTLAKLLG
ncbi:Tautomerase/MIF [Trametes punicea]|nr:Tautomerase/MIF [Trametes punicea]